MTENLGGIAVFYDAVSDIAYFRFSDLPVDSTKELDDLRWVDIAADGTLIGLQLFDASLKYPFLKRELDRDTLIRDLVGV